MVERLQGVIPIIKNPFLSIEKALKSIRKMSQK